MTDAIAAPPIGPYSSTTMGASCLVDDGLIDFAGGTGYRSQLGGVEEALYNNTCHRFGFDEKVGLGDDDCDVKRS
jgi:hypothetical protein